MQRGCDTVDMAVDTASIRNNLNLIMCFSPVVTSCTTSDHNFRAVRNSIHEYAFADIPVAASSAPKPVVNCQSR